MWAAQSSTINVYNNFISDLISTPSSTSIDGIYLSDVSSVNVFHNTVFLNNPVAHYPGFISSGIGFGGSVYNINLRNNIIVNTSASPRTYALRGQSIFSPTTTSVYDPSSDNNDFFAGPGGGIYYDGTTSCGTLAAFQSLVSPAEGASFSSLPPFINSATPPFNLHILAGIPTLCESGGSVVTNPPIVDDYDGDPRYPNPGYPDNPDPAYTATAPDVGADEFGGIPVTCTTPGPGTTTATATQVCQGQSVTVSLQNSIPGTGISYQWQSSSNGSTFTDIAGTNTSTITLTPSSSFYYRCIVTCMRGPVLTTSTALFIAVNPMPAPDAGPDRTICEGTGTQIGTSPAITGHTYTWMSHPAGFSSTSATPTVYPLVSTYYWFYETITNTGCTDSSGVWVYVDPLPAAAGPVSGPVCLSPGAICIYGIPPVSHATSYVWSIPPGGTIVSGNGTNTIIVLWYLNLVPGTISVYGINSCGDGVQSSIQTQVDCVPYAIIILDDSVHPGTHQCYNALETITVSGSGSKFLVQEGGDATLVAGQVIHFLPGTTVEYGGHLWAHITTTGTFCDSLAPDLLTITTEEPSPGKRSAESDIFRVYPNPTTGKFFLELMDVEESEEVFVWIYTIRGEMIHHAKLIGQSRYMFTLTGNPSGIYFLKIITKDKTGTARIVLN